MSDLGCHDFLRDHDRKTPCLRKDFMVHPIQVLEACEAGARAILIIMRALNDDEIKQLFNAANLAGLNSCLKSMNLQSWNVL